MNIKRNNHMCSICKRRYVKIFRPYMSINPTICTECTEKLKLLYEYIENDSLEVEKRCANSKNVHFFQENLIRFELYINNIYM